MSKLSAVVVGLGRAGSRFDEEPGREVAWSHVGAYLAHTDSFQVTGACDPDADARAIFQQRCPGVPVFAALDELMENSRPDVASICTPPESHAAVLDGLLAAPSLKVIWCEKPIAVTCDESEAMVEASAARGVTLVVSHVRRWLPIWRRFAQLLKDEAVGPLVCLRIAMPNRLWVLTSHAVDLALMMGGPVSVVQSFDLPDLEEDGEPARAAFLNFAEGGYGILQVTGLKSGLIVEVEAIGETGRLLARERDGEIRLERFAPSPRYEGYRELAESNVECHGTLATFSPFVEIAEEVVALASGALDRPSCSGADALSAVRILDAMDRCEPGGTTLSNSHRSVVDA